MPQRSKKSSGMMSYFAIGDKKARHQAFRGSFSEPTERSSRAEGSNAGSTAGKKSFLKGKKVTGPEFVTVEVLSADETAVIGAKVSKLIRDAEMGKTKIATIKRGERLTADQIRQSLKEQFGG